MLPSATHTTLHLVTYSSLLLVTFFHAWLFPLLFSEYLPSGRQRCVTSYLKQTKKSREFLFQTKDDDGDVNAVVDVLPECCRLKAWLISLTSLHPTLFC